LKIEIFCQEKENHRRKYLFARNYYCCKYKIIGMWMCKWIKDLIGVLT